MTAAPDSHEELKHERFELLAQLEDRLEMPMVVLGFVWLILLILQFVHKGPTPRLDRISLAIWFVFIVDFVLKFILAPEKLPFLKQNWLMVIALAVPALRVLRFARAIRILRAARAARGVRLVRVLGSINRGMRALSATMGRRGFGYVAVLTLIVTLTGAAGMYAFENNNPGGHGLNSYGTAVWWTAMVMTTIGSEYWPQTTEGRVLCFLLSLYAFTVFGYLTAALASFFIGRDAENDEAEVAGTKQIDALRMEIVALRDEIRQFAAGRGT
jgi:voltage-gated potassium channel